MNHSVEEAAINTNNSVQQIDHLTVSELTADIFERRYRRPGKPVVISDFLGSGIDWDLDFLAMNLGDQEFAVRDYGEGHFETPKNQWSKYCDHLKLSIHEFIAHVRDGSAKQRNLYLAQNPIGESKAALSIAEQMNFLRQTLGFEPAIVEATLNLWFGPAGHTELLHFDPSDGTMMMMHGKKRVILYPPTQSPNLYPFGFYDVLPFWISQVNIEAPDLTRYPNFHKSDQYRYEVLLSPGQLLFIPAQWWHEVIAEGDGYVSSCNHFWKVRPLLRNFQSLQGVVLYIVNFLPWKWVLRFSQSIHQLKKIFKR